MKSRIIFGCMVACIICALAACDENPDAGGPCEALSQDECAESGECTLVLSTNNFNHGPYECRVAADYCEEGFAQAVDTAEACESEPGCVFTPSNCYCPSTTICVCAGGPPAFCTF